MEHLKYFMFCLKVMLEEKKKFNLHGPDLVSAISQMSTFDGYFERPYERCAYMYKYATCHLSLMKDCFRIFLTDSPKIKELLLTWKTLNNIKLCSMSHGPALDYLAFIIALTENVEVDLQTSFDVINVISKSAQWKNTYNIMVEATKMGYLNDFPVSMISDEIKIVQDNKEKINEKQRNALQDVDILCMMKTFNFKSSDISSEKKQYFKEIISSMKANSLLFCIDTKPSVVALAEILYEIPGEYIYEPVFNSIRFPEKFPDDYKDNYGSVPVMGARGWFFVWKKFSLNALYNKIFPSILVEKLSSDMKVKTSVFSANEIDASATFNSMKTEASVISVQCSSKIKSDQNLEQNVTALCENTSELSTQANVTNSHLDFCDKFQDTLITNGKNFPMCSQISEEKFSALNQENCFMDQIAKSFNESLTVSNNVVTDSMSDLLITKTKSFVCDFEENIFKSNYNHETAGLKNDAEFLFLNKSESNNSLNQEKNLSGSKSFLNQSLTNLDNLSLSSRSDSISTSQSESYDKNTPSPFLTPDKAKKNKKIDFIEITSNKNIAELSTNPIDLSKKKIENKVTVNLLHNTPKKKSVKVGPDSKITNEGNSSIQDLTNRIKKLASSFENMLQNNQCKVVKESFKHQTCCPSCRSCTSCCQQVPFTLSNDTGISSSDSAKFLTSKGIECISDCNGTDVEACVHGMSLKTHDFKCPKQHFTCKCRTQNCQFQMRENKSCCMRHSCNYDALSLNRCCGHGSQNGLNLTVPNIIIPLENISDNTIAQLLAVLKTASSSKR